MIGHDIQWYLDMQWQCFDAGRLCDSSESYEGELDIPNLSEENDPEDVDVSRTSMIYFSDYIVCCMECRRVHTSSSGNRSVVDEIFTF